MNKNILPLSLLLVFGALYWFVLRPKDEEPQGGTGEDTGAGEPTPQPSQNTTPTVPKLVSGSSLAPGVDAPFFYQKLGQNETINIKNVAYSYNFLENLTINQRMYHVWYLIDGASYTSQQRINRNKVLNAIASYYLKSDADYLVNMYKNTNGRDMVADLNDEQDYASSSFYFNMRNN